MSTSLHRKIILVSNTSWSFYKFRKGLIEYLLKSGHSVYLLSPADEHISDLTKLGAQHITLKHMSAKGINPKKDFSCYLELKNLYSKIKPDIIFHYTIKPNIYGTYAAYKMGIKNVAVVTGLGFTFINKGIVPYIARQLYKKVLRKANKVWFLNQDDLTLFRNLHILEKNQGEILNSEGVDCDYFSPKTFKDHSLPTEFIFIGRLLYDKGIREYYEAASKLKELYPEIRCAILGYVGVNNPKAIDQKTLDSWISEGILHYYGASSDIRSYLEKASCLVLPSYREGISMVLLEASSMATPIIASNIPGCKEVVVHKQSGYLIPPQDSNALLEAMITFHQLSIAQKIQLGEVARKHTIAHFSLPIILQVYDKTISELLH